MTFVAKTWVDDPNSPVSPTPGTTPISAAALIDLETRLSNYTDSSLASLARYATIQANGTPVTQRSILNIIGATIVDNSGSSRTDLTITGTSALTVFNVKTDFGALGNGVADDTTAIQNALTAAFNAGGGIVFVPRGTYRCTATLLVKDSTMLIGAGMGATTLTWASDLGANQFAVNGGFGSQNTHVEVRDLTLSGPNSAITPGVQQQNMDGIKLGGNAVMRSVFVSSFRAGLSIWSDHQNFYDCKFSNCFYNVLWPSNRVSMGNHRFESCQMDGAGFACIAVEGNNIIDFSVFIECHVGVAPYGMYKFDGGSASSLGMANNSRFLNLSFEGIGNAAILDESTGTGSGQDTFNHCTIENPGMVWDDSRKIAARSQAFALVFRGGGGSRLVLGAQTSTNPGFHAHPTAGTAAIGNIIPFADIWMDGNQGAPSGYDKFFYTGGGDCRVHMPEGSIGWVAPVQGGAGTTINAGDILQQGGSWFEVARYNGGGSGGSPFIGVAATQNYNGTVVVIGLGHFAKVNTATGSSVGAGALLTPDLTTPYLAKQLPADNGTGDVPILPIIGVSTGSPGAGPASTPARLATTPVYDPRFLKPWRYSALPTASATYRGQLAYTEGGGGVADTLVCCMKAAGGTYSWKVVATG